MEYYVFKNIVPTAKVGYWTMTHNAHLYNQGKCKELQYVDKDLDDHFFCQSTLDI